MPTIFQSDHPYQATVYNYTVPSWPGGTHTVYITFSLDTFVDPFRGSFTLSTDLDSQTFSDIQWAGKTVAIQSSDGVLGMDTNSGRGSAEFYGFRALSVSLTAPTSYMLGNPNALDYVNPNYPTDDLYDTHNNAEGPNFVYADQTVTPLRLTPAQLNMVNMGITYQYGMQFPNATGTVTWSVSAGTLPPGLALDSTTGIISGTPTGNSGTFTISATDGTLTASGQFYIDVYPKPVDVGHSSFVSDGASYSAENFFTRSFAFPYGFHRNGARWCLLCRDHFDANALDRSPTVFKSTDDGMTWAEVGVATRPTPPTRPPGVGIGIGQAIGDGTHVLYTYNTGFSGVDIAVGYWLTITGFSQITAFNSVAIQVVEIGTNTLSDSATRPYYFKVNATTVGTESPTTHSDPTFAASASVQSLSTFLIRNLPSSYTSNTVTDAGVLDQVSNASCAIYNTGSGDTLYALTWFRGETGLSVDQYDVFVWEFDLSTLTWTCLTPGETSFALFNSTASGFTPNMEFVVLSTGVLRMFYSGLNSNDPSATASGFAAWMVDYTPGVGWGTPVRLYLWGDYTYTNPHTSASVTPRIYLYSVGLDSTDVCHALYLIETSGLGSVNHVQYVRITGSGVTHDNDLASARDVVFSTDPVTTTGLPIINRFGANFLGASNWVEIAALQQMVIPVWCYLDSVHNTLQTAVLRVDISTSTPSVAFERVQAWDSDSSSYDTTWFGGQPVVEYLGACALDPSGNLVIAWISGGYLENSDTDGVYFAVNTPASGATEHGWSRVQEYWSGDWSPYDPASNFGNFITSGPMSLEFDSGNMYVHIDGFPSASPGLNNLTFPPANPRNTILIIQQLCVMFQELGKLKPILPLVTPISLMS